LRVRCWTKFCT